MVIYVVYCCRLYKLIKKGKGNERVYFNLGMLAMDDKKIVAAEKWFKKAVEVSIAIEIVLS